MSLKYFRTLAIPLFIILLAAVWSTGPLTAQGATAVPTAESQETIAGPAVLSFDDVAGIVDTANTGWPRQVEGLNGIVTIEAKPLRIITASVGHDEMTLALVPLDRLVAVGGATKDATFSNVAALVQDIAEISRDPETIVAQAPDVVVTSPWFPEEGVDALSRVGIAVIQTALAQGPEERVNSILLMGYIYGEEERALEFATELRDRHNALIAVTGEADPRPLVLALTSYSDELWVAGSASTEGGIIESAGGVNAAAAAGIAGHQTTSLEGFIAMAPEVIIIAQPLAYGAGEFRDSLLSSEVLAEVPAIRDGAVHVVESKHFTTLSFWNLRGAEDLARILWPESFTGMEPVPFSEVNVEQ